MATERAKDGEKIKNSLIDEKKLTTIMKRFLGSKEADPDITKYYRVENGINFMATTLGSAVQIYFKNRHEGSFTKGTGQNFFRKPLPKEKYEDVDAIPEIEVTKDGAKKIRKPTGRYLEYPDVSGMFKKFNLDEFYKIEMPADDIDQFIAVHEAMEKAAKVGGIYNTAELLVSSQRIHIKLYDSPLTFEWAYSHDQENDIDFFMKDYHYDFAFMTSVMKSIKDLKVDKIEMYVKDKDNPILFVGKTVEYDYYFAIARKLVG